MKISKKDIKTFIKIYIFSTCTSLVLISLLDGFKYRNNIFYHNHLKLNEKQVSELVDELSDEVGIEITEDDNAIVLSAVSQNKNLSQEEKEYWSYRAV